MRSVASNLSAVRERERERERESLFAKYIHNIANAYELLQYGRLPVEALAMAD